MKTKDIIKKYVVVLILLTMCNLLYIWTFGEKFGFLFSVVMAYILLWLYDHLVLTDNKLKH